MRECSNFSKQKIRISNKNHGKNDLNTGCRQDNLYIEDKMTEECGVFGICNANGKSSAAELSYLGLIALQHRGQESAGICVNHEGEFNLKKGMGLVENVFEESDFENLKGEMAIGHVRYST